MAKRDLTTNPGGGLDPDEILGRDDLIEQLWNTLRCQSVYINDLRRMGKTQVMVKMEAQPRPGWVVIKRDLEGIRSGEEFATQVYRDVVKALSGSAKLLASMHNMLGKAAGLEIAGVIKLPDHSIAPWKEVLSRTLADLNAHMTEKKQFAVLMWDEVPYLLDNISQSSPATAGEILDLLRAASQEHKQLRFLLTGSIGLHHTLNQLKKNGYAGSPLNGMKLMRVGPLSVEHGKELALRLLAGEKIQTGNQKQAIADAIAEGAGNVPFYIHKLVSLLPRGQQVTSGAVDGLLERELSSSDNDWDFEHYRTRIDHHFTEHVTVALAVLDAVALSKSLAFAELEKTARSQAGTDAEVIREVLLLLCKDHYLTKSEGTYSFYLEVVRRWWQQSRDLQGPA